MITHQKLQQNVELFKSPLHLNLYESTDTSTSTSSKSSTNENAHDQYSKNNASPNKMLSNQKIRKNGTWRKEYTKDNEINKHESVNLVSDV